MPTTGPLPTLTRLNDALRSVEATFLPSSDASAGHPRIFFYGLERVTPEAWTSIERFLPSIELDVEQLLLPDGATARLTQRTGRSLRLPEGLGLLAALPPGCGSDSVRLWSVAAKLALEMAAGERFVPGLDRLRSGGFLAAWRPAPLAADAERLDALARAMPASAMASRTPDRAARGVLDDFLGQSFSGLVRRVVRTRSDLRAPEAFEDDPWEHRFAAALLSPDPSFAPSGFFERRLHEEVDDWTEPAFDGARDGYRAGFRVSLPQDEDEDLWRIDYLLQAVDDPSLVIGAERVWSDEEVVALGRLFPGAQEGLLRALGRAARLFGPIGDSLHDPDPTGVDVRSEDAWRFLTEVAPVLQSGGFVVLLPTELTAAGRRRLRLRMRVDVPQQTRKRSDLDGGLHADAVARFRWEAAVGDKALTKREYERIVAAKRPLVRVRGRWVVLDPSDIDRMDALVGTRGTVSLPEAAALALAGHTGEDDESSDEVVAGPALAELLEDLRAESDEEEIEPPADLAGTLRPYQLRGLSWLRHLEKAGLGGVLADDMGLGKTIQVIASVLDAQERSPSDDAPTLVVCPMSVVGNWEREIHRFAPKLPVVLHHGPDRSRTLEDLRASLRPHAIVLTSYGLMRRDATMLGEIHWGRVVLDEAQNVKNPEAKQSRAARSLPAKRRVALTGTPVENRLSDLWSIMQFANPGMLGSEKTFRERYGLPIERYGDADAAERLRSIVRPFVMRRVKTDPAIAPDLPEKLETTTWCSLTPEQATLYQAVVEEMLTDVEEAEGIERRGKVLALLTALKQICDHPALYLHEKEPLDGRSGKLARLVEMLEEVRDEGDAALVFTQYASMGRLLASHLSERLDVEALFLHGGTPRHAREEMIERFQSPGGPQVFVLSLKAGGVGLNLTRASHVFHYDRWWNPAVEDQATDRAYRIGQTRTVFAHTLLVGGTLEERIDDLLEKKRVLADAVIGEGEAFLTELSNDELRELVSLSGAGGVDLDDAPRRRRATPRVFGGGG